MYLLFLTFYKEKTICFAFCAFFCICVNKICIFDDNLKKICSEIVCFLICVNENRMKIS